MDIKEIINSKRNIAETIAELKNKVSDIKPWSVLRKDYEPLEHDIVTDFTGRKDKQHTDGSCDKAARLTFGLEKLLTKRITDFTFAIKVKRIYSNLEENETRKQISNAIEKIFKNARIDTENIDRGIAYYGSCEIFTLWYVVESPNFLYGFNSKWKLRCKTFSPMDGSELYPLFDEYGDMVAMSFEYHKTVNNVKTTFFETFTADTHYKWKRDEQAEWVLDRSEKIKMAKIPGAYLCRERPVYDGLTGIRNEIEYTLSRTSDTIAYNSAPVLMVSGKITGEENKGESQRVYRVANGGKVEYVSWNQSVEATKYYVDYLLKMFFMQAQMPDLSFENMKSLGNIGFDARQTVLSDAHLRIGEESGPWLEFLDREVNVVKAFLKEMNTAWKDEIDKIDVENVITPFIQNDEKSDIEKYVTASGGKSVISQLDAIKLTGLSQDPEETLAQIQKEEALKNISMNSVFESAM